MPEQERPRYSQLTGKPLAIALEKLNELQAGAVQPVAKQPQAADSKRSGDILVLPVQGLITQKADMDPWTGEPSFSTEAFAQVFQAAVADPSIGAIVLNFHSPGGEAYGTPELADLIFEARATTRIIASINSMAASAAYWLAASAAEISITPSGITGSVGVYVLHLDFAEMLEKAGIKPTLIKAGDNKAGSLPHFPLSDEARADLQKHVDRYYGLFVGAIARGRGVSRSKVQADYGQGSAMTAPDALERGMVDRIETLEQTLARLTKGAQTKRRIRAQAQYRQGQIAALKAKT